MLYYAFCSFSLSPSPSNTMQSTSPLPLAAPVGRSSSFAFTKRSSKLPMNGRPGLSDDNVVAVVVAVNGVMVLLRWPGEGSSSSSTRPRAFSGEEEDVSISGEGGGLRDLDRRASSCRNGMGEKSGVGGAADSSGTETGCCECCSC